MTHMRLIRVFAPAVLIAGGVIALLIGMQVGGAGAERPLLDPGTVVRYGVPMARMLVNLSGGVLVGTLILSIWALAGTGKEARAGLDLAAGAAAALTVSAAATFILVFIDVSGLEFSLDDKFGANLALFATEIELGQLWLLVVMVSAVTTVVCFAVQDHRLMVVPLLLGLVSMLPLAQQGHAAGAAGHAQAVNSLLVHLIGAGAWVGGLVTVLLLSRSVNRDRLAVITSRYSVIALLAFIGVATSGVVSAMLRIGSLADLFGTGYGKLVILKTLALLGLGAFGALHRQWVIPKISDSARGARFFGWFVVAELVVMGAASGFAAALGRSETPVVLEPAREQGGEISPAEWLSGDPLPPEFTSMSMVTEWKFDLLWTLVAAFAIVLYLAGVRKLAKRGDHWPVGRTIAWIIGLVLFFYTTNGALNSYERYLFSVHMIGHMMLAMVIPLILVLGAPITLLLRAVDKRHDGSWGAREWALWAVQTPYSKFITHPLVVSVIFVGSLWVFYFTPMLEWAMREHLGHQFMIIHFTISGYLFSLSMIGIDPVPYRFPYSMRILTLFATMAAHAFFGVTVMSSTGLLAADWFGAMGRTWGLAPLADQAAGGSIAWGIGEFPTLALAIIVAIQWMRNDDKVQKRQDRAADRSDDAELRAYNEQLAQVAQRDEQRDQRRAKQ